MKKSTKIAAIVEYTANTLTLGAVDNTATIFSGISLIASTESAEEKKALVKFILKDVALNTITLGGTKWKHLKAMKDLNAKESILYLADIYKKNSCFETAAKLEMGAELVDKFGQGEEQP